MSTKVRRLVAALALAGAVAVTGACLPAPPKEPPVPGRIAVAGDSTLFQALYYGAWQVGVGTADCTLTPPTGGWDHCAKVGLGWRASHAQGRVTQDVAGGLTSPERFAFAFGHNYVGDDGTTADGSGFTDANRNEVTAFFFSTHPDTCVVAILPYAGAGSNALRVKTIADYRAHVTQLAAARPHTVLGDWAAVASVHPEYIGSDGIHLDTANLDASRAFMEVVLGGLASC